jgi:glycerol-3-phosphate acyltransferase PlsY
LAALVAAIFAPFYYTLLFGPDVKAAAVLLMSVLLIYKHKANIGNLISGKESRLGKKSAS